MQCTTNMTCCLHGPIFCQMTALLHWGRSGWQHLQASHGLLEGLLQNIHAVRFGHADGVHRVAVPGRAVKVYLAPTSCMQLLCSFHTQPCCTMPAWQTLSPEAWHRTVCEYFTSYRLTAAPWSHGERPDLHISHCTGISVAGSKCQLCWCFWTTGAAKPPLRQALHCLVCHGDIPTCMEWHSKAQTAPLEGPKPHLRAAVT